VWDADKPEALGADEMGLGKTFTSVAAAMVRKLVTKKVVMSLPLSILWGNTLEEWVMLADNNFPGIVSEEWQWYSLQRLYSFTLLLLDIQKTPPHKHPALISAHESIVVVKLRTDAETVTSVIDEMTHRINFKLVILLHYRNMYLTRDELNTSVDMPEHRSKIHLAAYDTLHPGRNHQAMAESPTVCEVLGFWMSLIDTRGKLV